jgi:hypothetical protein
LDKYGQYDHSIATILRGFDEWYRKEHPAHFETGMKASLDKLIKLADQAQREIDECRAAGKGG